MNFYLKEPLYLKSNDNTEHIVRDGTIGVDRNKVVYFYDVTRTVSVGFTRDCCLENPNMFRVQREITDREVSVKDVLILLREIQGVPASVMEEIVSKIESL